MATTAAYRAFRRTWDDPAGLAARGRFEQQKARYDYFWHLYENSIFEDSLVWEDYRKRYGMYRWTRPIYNPTKRLVNFYAGIVYPGRLATDGKRLPDGTPLAIPLAEDINEQLRNAIGQLWQWTNWQTGKNLFVRYGAALGVAPVEILDEVDRGKVTFDIVWPGDIADLELDTSDNVKSYVIEYDAIDQNDKLYTYRREVNGERIAEYKDDELFQYDEFIPAERENPYGFAPMVWCRHNTGRGVFGSPAIRNINKIDELNEMASHAHDRAHAVLSSPILMGGKGVRALTPEIAAEARAATAEMVSPASARQSVKTFTSEDGGSMSTISLPEGEMHNYIDKLMDEIEHDHPELTLYQELRSMSQITGPAAQFLIGDSAAYVDEARSNYDQHTIKLHQMAIAIAGYRANNGDWGRDLNSQQQAFLPFDLASYDRGQLDFEIEARPIIPKFKPTADEQRVTMEKAERGFSTRAKAIDELGGNAEEDLPQIDEEQAAQRQREADAAQVALEQAQRRFDQGANGEVEQ